ncbi:hypothetical protein SLEP1_g57475 [Rubroshorea leprosula]|uniref:Uncharacterized protein n=1 Tax=Rubroshorea leprosula TaxID=152421 RepID=A0AAV5MLT1_9ROSI|nr:hypothetical protein SLEP1_g57475 [Rubroshorea leprosula]
MLHLNQIWLILLNSSAPLSSWIQVMKSAMPVDLLISVKVIFWRLEV